MKTTLVIMAAGIGSRFGGGIKQLAPVGLNGEIIMDYSIHDAIEWLSDQQEASGGFAPWRSHPVGENVYCTSVALLALISMNDTAYREAIERAYVYVCKTQLKSGVWAYHEIEDGASWGLYALSQAERYLEG